MSNPARLECYALIKDCMRTRILAYYQAHTDLIGDNRSQEAIKESMDGLDCIFKVLDEFEISKPEEKP